MRLPIISDTTRSVYPVDGVSAYGTGHEDLWFIGINCPVDGKYLSPFGPFDTREAAMASIAQGEF